MKISKLFHWLYAFLMLLPVFFIGGRCLYVTFNKNAKDSYYGETINEIILSDVEDDKLIGSVRYYFQNDTILINNNTSTYDFIPYNEIYTDNVDLLSLKDSGTRFRIQNKLLQIYSDNGFVGNVNLYSGNNVLNNFSFVANNTLTMNSYYSNFIFNVSYNKYSYLDNAFIYSVNSLNDVPLFSWAKTSFLVQPFSYISGLFGIASTNPINTMLSYWLAISIIWLVFDLIMYVPLLVHRWIDKAKLE